MKIKNPFAAWTRFEWWLWSVSMVVTAVCYIVSPTGDMLSLIASLIGVTSLLFLAKGHVLGQFLIITFALLYSVISLEYRYY